MRQKVILVLVVFLLAGILAGSNCLAAKFGERTLDRGCWGADVFELQMRLYDMGYDITADGRYGEKTRQAVIMFQNQKGLPATGKVDRKTALWVVARYGLLQHLVKPGETLSRIAVQYGVEASTIIRFNDVGSSLRAGQVLLIPATPKRQVREGDTLLSIAIECQTSIEQLLAINHLRDEAQLHAGMWLRLPVPEYL